MDRHTPAFYAFISSLRFLGVKITNDWRPSLADRPRGYQCTHRIGETHHRGSPTAAYPRTASPVVRSGCSKECGHQGTDHVRRNGSALCGRDEEQHRKSKRPPDGRAGVSDRKAVQMLAMGIVYAWRMCHALCEDFASVAMDAVSRCADTA
jgi:hypothetical protein